MTSDAGSSDGGVLDCHAHLNPEAYVATVRRISERDPALAPAVAAMTAGTTRFPLAYGALDRRVAAMDAAGVRTQYLSMAAPYPAASSPGARAEVCRAWNDATLAVADAHPGRFEVMLSVPMPDLDAACAEIDRLAGHERVAGIQLNTHVAGLPLDDPTMVEFYGRLDSQGMLVFLHPDGFCVRGLLEDDLNWDIGTQLDDTIAVTRLIYARIAERFPNVRWIVPHLGGALPFILERLDEHWRRDRSRRSLPAAPSECLQNLLFDTAGHGANAIRFGLSALGADHVVFGSDYPMVAADDMPGTVAKVSGCAPDRAGDLLHANLVRFLREPA